MVLIVTVYSDTKKDSSVITPFISWRSVCAYFMVNASRSIKFACSKLQVARTCCANQRAGVPFSTYASHVCSLPARQIYGRCPRRGEPKAKRKHFICICVQQQAKYRKKHTTAENGRRNVPSTQKHMLLKLHTLTTCYSFSADCVHSLFAAHFYSCYTCGQLFFLPCTHLACFVFRSNVAQTDKYLMEKCSLRLVFTIISTFFHRFSAIFAIFQFQFNDD